jgi:hypothetical protein
MEGVVKQDYSQMENHRMSSMTDNSLTNYFSLLSPLTKNLITAGTDRDFDTAFDTWLVEAINRIEANKLNFKDLGEESLSAVLAASLTTPEISVTQEQNSNGHVDLTIKLTNAPQLRIKLGEAKIWRGKEYHVNGLGQLINRYTTGRECRGFVISYVKIKDVANLFIDLRHHIDTSKPFNLDGLCQDHNIRWSFISIHKHTSGESISVCHVGCNLH